MGAPVGRAYAEFGQSTDENQYPSNYAALESLPETGALSYEYRFRRADGRYRWIHDEMVQGGASPAAPQMSAGA